RTAWGASVAPFPIRSCRLWVIVLQRPGECHDHGLGVWPDAPQGLDSRCPNAGVLVPQRLDDGGQCSKRNGGRLTATGGLVVLQCLDAGTLLLEIIDDLE